jgi:type 1 fimbria pilin
MSKVWWSESEIVGAYIRTVCTLTATAVIAVSLTLLTVFLFSSQGWAATVNITVKGVITAKPKCDINAGKDINVSFGDNLLTTKIDGVNYRKRIPYFVSCTGDISGTNALLKVSLQGVEPGFGKGLLRTNNANLGIKLLQENGEQVMLNTWLNFTYPNTPLLYAVPVKRDGNTLQGGIFSGAATLIVDVQ